MLENPYRTNETLTNVTAVLMGITIVGVFASTAALSLGTGLLAVISICYWFYHRKKTGSFQNYWQPLGPDYLLTLFWLTIIVGAVAVSIIPSEERIHVAATGKWILHLYAMVAAFSFFKINPKTILKVFVFVGIPVAILGIYQSFSGFDPIRHRESIIAGVGSSFYRGNGFNTNTMTFGHNLSLVLPALLPIILFRIFKNNKKFERVLFISWSLMALALLLTFTRGAWLGALFGLITVLFMWNRKAALKVIAVSALIGAIVISTVPEIRQRVTSITAGMNDPTSKDRIWIWQSSWEMFKDHYLLGVGMGRTRKEITPYNVKLRGIAGEHEYANNAHNNSLQILTGTGLFGFMFWASAMIWFLVSGLRRFMKMRTDTGEENNLKRALHLGFIGSFIAFHIGGLTQTTCDDVEVLTLMCVWLAMSIGTTREMEQTL